MTSDSSARFRWRLGEAELDLQGEALIAEHADAIQALVAKLISLTPERPEINATRSTGSELVLASSIPRPVAVPSSELDGIEDFGEVYHRVPRSATNVDKALVAAWFVHRTKENKIIETRDVSTLLVEQGVKLSNASQAMTNNLNRRLVFKSGGGYRMAREGIDFVERLLSSNQ